MKSRTQIGTLLLVLTLALALSPLYRSSADIPIAQHHLYHAIMLAGAALCGILLAGFSYQVTAGRTFWLLAAMLCPVLAMFLMWPSEYAYFETHAYGHVLEHLGLVLLGFLTGYAGQRYANGIGWAAGISAVAMALISIWGYGVAPH